MVFVVAAASVAVVANWLSRLRGSQRVEWVTKPSATVLIALTVAVTARLSLPTRAGFLLAFTFCLVGDVLLMLAERHFVGGLVAFLVGHVIFTLMLARRHPQRPGLWLGVTVIVVMSALVGRPLLKSVARNHRAMLVPVVAYFAVISTMVLVATWRGGAWASAGAIAFYASDALLAWDTFVRPVRVAEVGIMVTYHLALAGLAAGAVNL